MKKPQFFNISRIFKMSFRPVWISLTYPMPCLTSFSDAMSGLKKLSSLTPTITYTTSACNPSIASVFCPWRYHGTVECSKREWVGVEWNQASRRIHSGDHAGVQYFTTRVTGSGSFVRRGRLTTSEGSFAEVGKIIAGIKFGSFLTPEMVSINDVRHGIRLPSTE